MSMQTGQPISEAIGPKAEVVGNSGPLLTATDNALRMNSLLTMVGSMDKSPAAGVRVGMPIDAAIGSSAQYHAQAPQQDGQGHHHHRGRGRFRQAMHAANIIKDVYKLMHAMDTPPPTQAELIARANAQEEQRKAEAAKEDKLKAQIAAEDAIKKGNAPPKLG